MISEEAFKELNELKKESEAKKTTLEPFDIRPLIKNIEKMELDNAIKSAKELNQMTPRWLVITTDVDIKTKKVTVETYFSHEKMGDMIIKEHNLFRIPKLLEGAMYDKDTGAWRYFGKNEMAMFSEKICLEQLQAWGFYDERRISPVSRYVKQKSYDPSFFNENPFENSKPELVVFKNGTYNILTDTIKSNDPEDYIMTSFDYELDIAGTKTPHTDKFFNAFFEDSALFMKQYLGYIFYRSYSPSPDMVFLCGDGGEGKSSFLNMVRDFYVKPSNISSLTPEQISKERFSVVDLLGKSVNICGDIDSTFLQASAMLKRVTGSDSIKGELKGIQGFSFISYAKLLFSMNGFFHFADMSTGFSSRLTAVPIKIGDQRVPDATFWKDHDMDLIEKEAPSFVYSCMREFNKIFDGRKANFTTSKSMDETKREWLFDNDRIAQFLFEATEFIEGDERGEIASTVYKEYKGFCSFNGFIPKSAKEVTKYLKNKGISKKKSSQGFNDGGTRLDRYIGLKLLTTFLSE